MASGRPPLSPWLKFSAFLVALYAVGLIGLDIGHRGEGDSRVTVSAGAAPPTVTPTPEVDPMAPVPLVDPPARSRSRRAETSAPNRAADAQAPAPEPVVTVRRGKKAELRDTPAGEVVARVADETSFGSPSAFSVARVRKGWLGVPTSRLPNGDLGWLKADPDVLRGSYVDLRIVVDLSRHEARLLEGHRLLRQWTVTVGAPGSETPTGRFSVTDIFEGGLNPAYGCCAVALSATQPNLPSGWIGGNLIAFHGTDGPIGVDASNGCITSADRDVRALVKTVSLGTPVRIRG